MYVYEALGYHQGNDVRLLAESVDSHIHHIKSFSEDFMAEGKSRHDFSDDAYPVVFNHFF